MTNHHDFTSWPNSGKFHDLLSKKEIIKGEFPSWIVVELFTQ